MWTNSSRRTSRGGWLVAALLALLSVPAFAGQKEDLYKQAASAAVAGKADEAAKLYCQVAQIEPGFKDAKMMCTIMSMEVEKERKKNEERFSEGVKAFNEGKYEDAEQKFRNIRSGARLDEARQYLTARIPQARSQAAAGEETRRLEGAMNAKFDDAVRAFQRNDFNGARGLFSQISGKRQGEARDHLNKIKQYEQAMTEGETLANAKNFKGAINSFTEAANIKGDGPGDPHAKIRSMQTAMAGASAPPPTVTPTTTATTTVATGTVSPPPRQPAPTPTAIIVQKEKPAIDVARLLREAETATNKGNIAAAKGKYLAVLAAEPNNSAARSALEALAKQSDSSAKAAPASSEADVMLAKGIGEYYTGKLEEAEVHIKDYLSVNGSKTALSNFYLGVCKLTRYYLEGGTEQNKRLLLEAQVKFKLAKKTAGFQPPNEKYLSPKILKVYKDATP